MLQSSKWFSLVFLPKLPGLSVGPVIIHPSVFEYLVRDSSPDVLAAPHHHSKTIIIAIAILLLFICDMSFFV